MLSLSLQCLQTLSFGLKEEQSKLYIVYLGEKKHDDPKLVTASHYDLLSSVLGSKEAARGSIACSYKHGFSGFAAMLTESQAKTVSALPEVISIVPNRNFPMLTTRSWDFLGLNHIQPQGLLHDTNSGDGMIIGVIDSGIWPESRSFQDAGFGPIPSRWRGKCQVGQAFNATNCNRKLIGARFYTVGVDKELIKQDFLSPRGAGFHGTHTASTAAGNLVSNISFLGLASGTVRGGAPRARLAVYKTCWAEGGSCSGAAVVKAIDDAIHDGVDVISVSIALAERGMPYASLHAVAKGIVAVFGGGNQGPAAQTVQDHTPWVITVAASTMDRSFPTEITLGNNQKLVAQSIFTAKDVANNFTELYNGGSCDESLLNDTDIAGKILFCSPAAVELSLPDVDILKAVSIVQQTKAKGLIYSHYSNSETDKFYCTDIPCLLLDFEASTVIKRYADTVSTPMVKVAPTRSVVGSEVLAPKISSYSSRGPSPAFPGQIKPDVAAPGTVILAAYKEIYIFASGTSMATPHVSAIAALIKSRHPDWSPAAIKSALMTTASITTEYGEPIKAESVPKKLADPFDFGAGVVNPNRAADPGLVYDIDPKDYFKFFKCDGDERICDEKRSNIYDMNLPSISVHDLTSSRTVMRTATNVGNIDAVYKAVVEVPAGVKMVVEPSVLHFSASSKAQAFKITFTAKRKVQGDFKFGSLTWVEEHGTHTVRIPIAVRVVIEEFYADV